MDLSRFGKLGQTLKESAGPPASLPTGKKDPEVEAPVKLSTPAPVYPAALAAGCLEGTVVISSILGADGVLRGPRLAENPGGPVMAFAAFEALRTWKLRPARKQGRTVDSLYTLTVNFIAPGSCKQP